MRRGRYSGYSVVTYLVFCFTFFFSSIAFCQDTDDINNWIYVEPYPAIIYEQELRIRPASSFSLPLSLETAKIYEITITVHGGGNRDINLYVFSNGEFQNFKAFGRAKARINIPRLTGSKSVSFSTGFLKDYVLFCDNSFSIISSKTVHIRIIESDSDVSSEIKKNAKETYEALKRAFVFPYFKMNFQRCGAANAFGGYEFTFCYELLEDLRQTNPEIALPASLFVMFHEYGHTLLYHWGYPLWDNEDAADEFATAVLLMGQQEKIAEHAAEFWRDKWSISEPFKRMYADDRHSLSLQRANNIIRWIAQKDELMKRWQKILVPNMQTEELRKSLFKDGPHWIDKTEVRSELIKRGALSSPKQ